MDLPQDEIRRTTGQHAMADVDKAFESFVCVKKEFENSSEQEETPLNEAATRLKLIDPLLTDVLGWSRGDQVWVELQAGEGRLDYLLKDSQQRNCLVIEAKKSSVSLAEPYRGKPSDIVKLGGPVLTKCLPIIEEQMSGYLGTHNPLIAVLTNGTQWIGFLSGLGAAGTPPAQSRTL